MFESQQLAIGAVAQKDANSKGEKNRDSMNLMKKVLERVMAREKSVITEWCSRNSTQMQTALNAVTHLHEQAENMQKDLQDSHASLAVRSHVCFIWMCLASVPDAFLTTGALTTCRELAPSPAPGPRLSCYQGVPNTHMYCGCVYALEAAPSTLIIGYYCQHACSKQAHCCA